ncbi:MAG: YARHG domain-containing protein [Treponema sp.]|nr:YARHG domain-containing protein [Treponema sp.]
MKRKILEILLYFILLNSSVCQTIEKLFQTTDVILYARITSVSPFGIYVDEVNDNIEIMNGNWDGGKRFTLSEKRKTCDFNDFTSFWTDVNIRFENVIVGYSDSILTIQRDKEFLIKQKLKSGISFILKKDGGYIIYYVDDSGYPGAVDTTGKVYNNKEAMAFLKEYDPQKYEQSLQRALELELYYEFLHDMVLIWGNVYYKKYNELHQYDIEGKVYHLGDYGDICSILSCYENDDCLFYIKDLNPYSEIRKTKDLSYTMSWYVGFGGNIYYYISCADYTEVFRVRRTWGAPNFYAMAINGYTDDNYGDYVNKVLPTLSKADLRILRNTIYALYGVHFKSPDLSAHFDKQVWYTDQGKSSGEIILPEHRQQLVEMIQALEAK